MQYRMIKQIFNTKLCALSIALLLVTSGPVLADNYYQSPTGQVNGPAGGQVNTRSHGQTGTRQPYRSPYQGAQRNRYQSGYQGRYHGDAGSNSAEQQDSKKGNPWALPPVYDEGKGFGQRYVYSRQRFEGRKTEKRDSGYRFVTPGFLHSLKQQQMQMQGQYQGGQMLPPQRRRNEQGSYGYSGRYSGPESSVLDDPIPSYPPSIPSLQNSYGSDRYRQGGYGGSMYGMNPYESSMSGMPFADSLYDTPGVSPWGGTPDVLYRGDSFPWLPNEAIGGLSPIEAPLELQPGGPGDLLSGPEVLLPEDKSRENTGVNGVRQNHDGVFNPYDFAPNSYR